MNGEALGFRPLYRQVRDILIKRIVEGVWQAGELLPSEPVLAADLGVSQGTVRKALDAMTAENLVVRRQGRGTFVAKHDDPRLLSRFFRLVPDKGERRFPESRVTRAAIQADPAAAGILGLARRDEILRIERVRSVNGEVCIIERISLPSALVPDLQTLDLPDNLYETYARRFGVRIAHASEKLKAVAAEQEHAELLGVKSGSPLLQIERLAYSLDARPIEWRVSLCRTDRMHYTSDLR